MASLIAYILTPCVEADGVKKAGMIGPFRTADEACQGAVELERAYPDNEVSLCLAQTALSLESPEMVSQFVNARGVLASYLMLAHGGAV